MTTRPSLETRALYYLARREYSRLELERKLGAISPTPTQEEVSTLLNSLEKRGFLSAQRVIEQIIQTRRCKFGNQRIIHELRKKGIDERAISTVLPDLKETELNAAYKVWQKKFNALPTNIHERAKQTRFLINRGFSTTVINQVFSHTDQE